MASLRNSPIAWAPLLVLLGCTTAAPREDSALEGLDLSTINPKVIVPGTALTLDGSSFVDEPWGTSSLRLRGTYQSDAGVDDIDVSLPAGFVDFDRLQVAVDDEVMAGLGGEGDFEGEALVEVVSSVDGHTYSSPALYVNLTFRSEITPRLDSLQSDGLIFVNDPIEVSGGGLLLGGDEGTTYAVVAGCYTPEGEAGCTEVGPTEVPVEPAGAFDRNRGHFAFAPDIAGIRPGSFAGTVRLRNRHSGGAETSSDDRGADYDLIRSVIFDVSPSSASLGQYVEVTGGGFVGDSGDQLTLLQLDGEFTPTGESGSAPVDLLLVPEFVAGPRVRYVVNEDDSLGQMMDLRTETGTFVGQLTPIIRYGADEVVGDSSQVTLSIAPVKQVIYLRFLPSYVESLRHFGLRAVDAQIRERVAEVIERDFATINLEVRRQPPEDFALYSQVDIAGPDPNGLGLLGYDNTPGKDTDNERLYDRIGGVNAETQEDGYPGYGGVFIESLFGFSPNPGGHASSIPDADPIFDEIFDVTRPDRGGRQVRAADLSGGLPKFDNGDACPAGERTEQIACAVFVLGSVIGTTVSHEIGHSLGLANPYGDGFHNLGDGADRLMDNGTDRSFRERAELSGEGPGRFCDDEYEYLRRILPTSEPEDTTLRPSCF